jgi:hypothetical protein
MSHGLSLTIRTPPYTTALSSRLRTIFVQPTKKPDTSKSAASWLQVGAGDGRWLVSKV